MVAGNTLLETLPQRKHAHLLHRTIYRARDFYSARDLFLDSTVRMYAAGDSTRAQYNIRKLYSVHNRTLRLKREKLSFGWS